MWPNEVCTLSVQEPSFAEPEQHVTSKPPSVHSAEPDADAEEPLAHVPVRRHTAESQVRVSAVLHTACIGFSQHAAKTICAVSQPVDPLHALHSPASISTTGKLNVRCCTCLAAHEDLHAQPEWV
jgi:hypothetical protein